MSRATRMIDRQRPINHRRSRLPHRPEPDRYLLPPRARTVVLGARVAAWEMLEGPGVIVVVAQTRR
jgi:hypothetical protein